MVINKQQSFEALSSSRTFLHLVKDFASSKLPCFSLCVHHYISRRDVTIFSLLKDFGKSVIEVCLEHDSEPLPSSQQHILRFSVVLFIPHFFFLKICTSMIKTLEHLENTGIEASRISTCNTGEVKIQNCNKEKRSWFRRSD